MFPGRFWAALGSGEASNDRALQLFSKWQPPAGSTFHQFVGRLDGDGEFAVVETENPAELLDSTGKFAPFNVFQVYPLVDMNDGVQTTQAGVEFRGSIS
jgi:hypothetical protein